MISGNGVWFAGGVAVVQGHARDLNPGAVLSYEFQFPPVVAANATSSI